jgi:hypothetical protein
MSTSELDATFARLADRLAVVREVADIETDLRTFEQHSGPCADCEELRERLTATRRLLLAQVLALVDVLNESRSTVH